MIGRYGLGRPGGEKVHSAFSFYLGIAETWIGALRPVVLSSVGED
jgi:hypothetical protein